MGFLSSIGGILGSAVGGPIGGTIGSAAGGFLDDSTSSAASYFGQAEANRAALASTREQMEFQREMSNTAHTREVADLKAAGLNPMLTGKYGGSSTPGGSSTTFQSAAGAGVSSGLAATRLRADLDNLRETNSQIKSSTALNEALSLKAIADAGLSDAQAANVGVQGKILSNDASKSDVTRLLYDLLKPAVSSAKSGGGLKGFIDWVGSNSPFFPSSKSKPVNLHR